MKTCAICGRAFTPRVRHQKYCAKPCVLRAWRLLHPEAVRSSQRASALHNRAEDRLRPGLCSVEGAVVERVCICGARFTTQTSLSDSGQWFCSPECREEVIDAVVKALVGACHVG